MNYLNNIPHFIPLLSEYRGPRILLFAGKADEEEEDPEEETPSEEEASEEEESEDEEDPDGEESPEEDDDPLETENPYEEGSSQHDAFEKQREKFKKKLETEVEAAREGASAGVSKKLDDLMATLSGSKKKEDPEKKSEEPIEISDVDEKIVLGVLKKAGFDPQKAVQAEQKRMVEAAVKRLKDENPDIEFDPTELIKHANDEGISAMGGDPYKILRLALLDKYQSKKKKSSKKEDDPKPKKKDAVNINDGGTKKKPSDSDEPPKTQSDWKKKILGKYGGK